MFERRAYEATLAACGDLAPVLWRLTGAGRVPDADDDHPHGSLADRIRGGLVSVIAWPVDAWHRRGIRRRYPGSVVSRRFRRNRGWIMYGVETRPGRDEDPAD